ADQARPKSRRWCWSGARLLTGYLVIALVSLVAMTAPCSAARNDGGITVLAPGVLFYDHPAAGVVGAQEAMRAWVRLAPLAAAEIVHGLTSGVLFAHFY